MRTSRLVLGAVVAASAVVLVSASLGAGLPAPKLALVPLPKAAIGTAAAGLELATDSGPVTNADAADNTNGSATAATFVKLGRLRGYTLDYGNEFVGGAGIRKVQTTVEVYSSTASARKGFAFWQKDQTSLTALHALGLQVSISPVAGPAVGDEHFAYLGRISTGGQDPVYEVDAFFRSGPYVVDVSTAAGTAVAAETVTRPLVQKAESRLATVLAGKSVGPAPVLPPAVKPGPPPHGPDLSALALTAADLGQATVTHQGYQTDTDLDPVSEYGRHMQPGGSFAAVDDEVILMHSPAEAGYTVAVMAAALSKPDTFSDPSVKGVVVQKVPVSGGDEAYASIVSMTLKTGKAISEAIVLVRRGPVIAFVTAATAAKILPSAATQLVSLAGARLK